jgi:hypothetical protein
MATVMPSHRTGRMCSWPTIADISAITIGEMPMISEPLPTLVRLTAETKQN